MTVGSGGRGGGEHITSRSGSFTLVSILVSPECLRSAELARTIETREHSRRWNYFWFRFWDRNHGFCICGGGIRGLLLAPEIIK